MRSKSPKRFSLSRFSPIARSVLVVAAVVLVVSGVTFAALQSQQAVLKGNTIQTATANLQLSPDGTTYSNSLSGYTFSGLIPGGTPTPVNGYPVYLKNGGSTALALKLSASSSLSNPDKVDLSKVHILLSLFGGGAPQNITLQDLIAADATGGVALTGATHLSPDQSTAYMIQMTMETDAITGPSATLSNLDLNFSGLTVN